MLFEKKIHWFFFLAACLFSFFPEVATLRRLSVSSSVIFIAVYVCEMQSKGIFRKKFPVVSYLLLVFQHSLIMINSRPCKIHPTAQANLFTAFFLAPFAAASAVASIQSCANKGVKKPFRPRRTMALSSQQML